MSENSERFFLCMSFCCCCSFGVNFPVKGFLEFQMCISIFEQLMCPIMQAVVWTEFHTFPPLTGLQKHEQLRPLGNKTCPYMQGSFLTQEVLPSPHSHYLRC